MKISLISLGSLLLSAASLAIIETSIWEEISPRQESEIYDELSGRDNRIFLKDGELIRDVEYFEDKITRRHATVINTDSSLTEFWYWPSGNLKEAITYFPENASDKGPRQIQRHATLLEDGITYATDFEYNRSGLISTSTILDKTKELATRRQFAANGKLTKEELFTKRPTTPFETWYRLSSRTFHANENLFESFEAVGFFGYEIKRFSADNRLLFASQLSDYATEYRENWFFVDGKSLRREVFQNSEGTNVKTYAPKGTLLEERAWHGPVQGGMMNIKSFDPVNGNLILEQLFMQVGGKYLPYSFTVFKEDVKSLYVLLYLDGRNSVQSTTEYHSKLGDSGAHTTTFYDKDGYLIDQRREADNGTTFWLHNYKSSDKVKSEPPALNPEWIALRPYEMPPKIVKFEPSPYR